MNFIILGDKYQKGMKSKGCAGLIKIDKHNHLFEYQYSIIKQYFPKADIVYIGGFESKKIETFINKNYPDVVYVHNEQYDNFSDGYSISLIKNYLISDTFIILGYHILDKKLFENFNTKLGTQIVVTPNNQKQTGCIINNNQIDNISFDLPNYVDDIYYLSMKDSATLQQIVSDIQYKNYFLFELINKLIDLGAVVRPLFYKTNKNKNKYYEYTN